MPPASASWVFKVIKLSFADAILQTTADMMRVNNQAIVCGCVNDPKGVLEPPLGWWKNLVTKSFRNAFIRTLCNMNLFRSRYSRQNTDSHASTCGFFSRIHRANRKSNREMEV